MKRVLFVSGIVFLVSLTAGAQELSLDEILGRYYKAAKLDALQQVRTVIMTGTITQNDVMPVKIIKMRPDKYFMEFDVADMTAYQAYDGKTAWTTAPWTRNPKPQPMNGDRLTDMKNKADFDGLLFNWQAKGHMAELAGTDTVNQSPVYKIKLSRSDGGVEFYFIDQNSYMLVKRQFSRLVRGQETIMEGYVTEFRMIDGIPFACTQVNYMGGQPYNTLQFETIELNKPVEEKTFSMPE